jgi:hypothetical protein
MCSTGWAAAGDNTQQPPAAIDVLYSALLHISDSCTHCSSRLMSRLQLLCSWCVSYFVLPPPMRVPPCACCRHMGNYIAYSDSPATSAEYKARMLDELARLTRDYKVHYSCLTGMECCCDRLTPCHSQPPAVCLCSSQLMPHNANMFVSLAPCMHATGLDQKSGIVALA